MGPAPLARFAVTAFRHGLIILQRGRNVTISSRTPEGLPNRCPVCGAEVKLEPSWPAEDACCPNCGSLLWYGDRTDLLAQTSRSTGARKFEIEDSLQGFPIEVVLGLLKAADPELQQWAICQVMIRGLEERGTGRQLLVVLFSSDPSLRERAARALARRHPVVAEEIEKLVADLQSSDESRWKQAATSIEFLLRRS
jgi:hypothetical protein